MTKILDGYVIGESFDGPNAKHLPSSVPWSWYIRTRDMVGRDVMGNYLFRGCSGPIITVPPEYVTEIFVK